jgi:phospholipid-binding lipoprotein MlaA
MADDFDPEHDDEFSKFESEINKSSVNDPLEKYNRKIFAFNEIVDKNFFEKIARGYRKTIPKPPRTAIRNFLNNISLPVSAFNSFTQGKIDNGFATISSFLINSTLGIGGFFDIAKIKGITYENEDFGQTLGYYGIESNIFLVIPFLGPSNLRDFSGMILDRSIDPTGVNIANIGGDSDFIEGKYRVAKTILNIVDTREELLDIISNLRKDSFDSYSTVRSAYLQRRLAQIEK